MSEIVGDRFVRTAGGWIDMVTGRVVDLRAGLAPSDIARRAAWCESLSAWLPGGRQRIVDYGRWGSDRWFEAFDTFATDAWAGEFALTAIARATDAAWTQIAPAQERSSWTGARRIELAAPPRAGGTFAMCVGARQLRALGFIALRASLKCSSRLRRHLRHRHLALFVATDEDREAAVRWASELTAVSDRAFLIIERVRETAPVLPCATRLTLEPVPIEALLSSYQARGSVRLDRSELQRAAEASAGWPPRFVDALTRMHANRSADSFVLRERALALPPAASSDVVWPFSVSASVARDSRARAMYARGRVSAGDRWITASLAAIRRRGDATALLRQLHEWVPQLIGAGRPHRAAELATRALADAGDPLIRASIARLAAAAHCEAANLMRASACIDTAICIEQLTPGGPAIESLAVRGRIRFWQGRWREGRAELSAIDSERARHPALLTWRGLLAWADDQSEMRRGMTGAASDWWQHALQIFRAAAQGTATGVSKALTEGEMPPAWANVIAAQAWLDAGHDERAAAHVRRWRLKAVGRRVLVDCAASSIRRALGLARREESAWLDAITAREQLRGLVRWGQRRVDMQMLHDVSQLLEIVQGSEDEASGLTAICRWIERASGATMSAIAGAPGVVVAGSSLSALHIDGAHVRTWIDQAHTALDEDEVMARAHAPIRYGASVIGAVIGSAPVQRARPLFGAVQAAASVCGAMLRARLDAMASANRGESLARDILGASPAIDAVRVAAARAAMAPFPVVIEGESGTGKELVARALHKLGARRDRPFAALNCAAITDELIEAELFGHARGAFTHAVNARAGLFEEAHLGTLFLDEVGDLSPRAQAKLLRVLQEGEIRRVGENDSRAVDVRVVAATNRPLAALVAAGRFRDDLMFRLSVIRIQVPPLRERSGDVATLALAFWRSVSRRVNSHAILGPDAIAALTQMPWPGNVRELQNAMSAIAVAAPAAGRVSARLVRHVLDGISTSAPLAETDIVPLEQARRQMERKLVTAALARHTGSRMAAANALGLSRQGLNKAIRRLGLVEAGVA